MVKLCKNTTMKKITSTPQEGAIAPMPYYGSATAPTANDANGTYGDVLWKCQSQ